MWDYIINIHPSELLRSKPNSLELMIIRKFLKKIKKIDNLHFLPNNILIRLFNRDVALLGPGGAMAPPSPMKKIKI